jgi:hypothetical protein
MPTFLLLWNEKPVMMTAKGDLHACDLVLQHMKQLPENDVDADSFETIWSELHRWCIYVHCQTHADAARMSIDAWAERNVNDLRVNLHKLVASDILRAISTSHSGLHYGGVRSGLEYNIWHKENSIELQLVEPESLKEKNAQA